MRAVDRVQEVLASADPDWSSVTLLDVSRCVTSKIGRYRTLRRYRHQPEGVEDLLKLAGEIQSLFCALARKHAERGGGHIAETIRDLEAKMAEPDRINPFDSVYPANLRREHEGLVSHRQNLTGR